MCLLFDKNKIFVAKRNIPVWKVFYRSAFRIGLVTPYQKMPIDQVTSRPATEFSLRGGYHCFLSLEAARRYLQSGTNCRETIRELYIPKGAVYHKDTHDKTLVASKYLISPAEARKGKRR
jgi:hypothetical protein